jgi:hypothetical protein
MSNGVAPQGHRLDDVTSSSWNRSSLRGAKFVPELPETCRSAYGLGLLSTGGSSTQQAAAPLDHDVMWRDRGETMPATAKAKAIETIVTALRPLPRRE